MGGRAFDYFVVLAGMRTGSNLLEEYLSAMPGLTSFGELFNPHFFGKPNVRDCFGLSIEDRDRDPVRVIEAMCAQADGLPGFRLFHDHDARVIDHVLADERAAKVVLSRRPVESYVSLKIARRTGQWWLGDLTSARRATVAFDAKEYAEFVNTLLEFKARVRRGLQTTGQTAFEIDYDDLNDLDVIGGLGRYLGANGAPEVSKVRAKVQNPTPVLERLSNPDEAEAAMRRIAAPDLGYIPSFEPDRGPGLRQFHACGMVPLLYMPIRGAGLDPVPAWMEAVDPEDRVESGMTQKDVRRWMRKHPGHLSFTILRHPLPRAYDAFCRCILPEGVEGYEEIRHALTARYGVSLPGASSGRGWTRDQHGAAFLGFLTFLKGNLGGQTSLRVDHAWASQAAFLQAIARFTVPDRIVREDRLAEDLSELAALVGVPEPQAPEGRFDAPAPFDLSQVWTDQIDSACEAAYRRDYVFFGFGKWEPPGQAA